MARLTKFASMNLNESYGKPERNGSTARAVALAASNSPSAPKQRLLPPTQGGMLVLSRPCRSQSTTAKSTKMDTPSTSTPTPSKHQHPVIHPPPPVSAAITLLVPGWLKNTQQQQIQQPASTAGSEAISETTLQGRSGGLIAATEAGSVANPNVDINVDVGSQSVVGRSNVYIPPNRRALQANQSATPCQLPAPQPQKPSVLNGEEFPTLQASIVRPRTPPQHQQRQREAYQKQREEMTEQQLKLQQLSQQAQAQRQNTGGELKLQPAQPIHSRSKPNFATSEQHITPTDERYGDSRNVDVLCSRASHIVPSDHVINWADDEREVGQTLRPQRADPLINGGGKSHVDMRKFTHSPGFENLRAGIQADLSESEHHEFSENGNHLRDIKGGLQEVNAIPGPNVNEREGNKVHVPPFAREGRSTRDQVSERKGFFSRDQTFVKDARDGGYEHQEGYLVYGGGYAHDSGSRKEYLIGKEKIGKEASNRLEYSPDGNGSWQNGDVACFKRDNDVDAKFYNKAGTGRIFSTPNRINQEMPFGLKHGYGTQAEDVFASRSRARTEYGQKTFSCFNAEPWNPRGDVDNFGSRRMTSSVNDSQLLVLERESFEEKYLEEERFKREENKWRNARIRQEQLFSSEADFVTQRLSEEERHMRKERKGCYTRAAPEKYMGYGHSMIEASRYLHDVGFRGFATRAEQNGIRWMTEGERPSHREEGVEVAIHKFAEREEIIAHRKVDERNWRERPGQHLSIFQQGEDETGISSAEPEWEHMVSSFSGLGESGNGSSLRPSSAASSPSSTQWSRSVAEESSQHANMMGTKKSIPSGPLENQVGKESKFTRSKSPLLWRKEVNVSSNVPTSRLFSSPYIDSTGVHRSTDSGPFKLF